MTIFLFITTTVFLLSTVILYHENQESDKKYKRLESLKEEIRETNEYRMRKANESISGLQARLKALIQESQVAIEEAKQDKVAAPKEVLSKDTKNVKKPVASVVPIKVRDKRSTPYTYPMGSSKPKETSVSPDPVSLFSYSSVIDDTPSRSHHSHDDGGSSHHSSYDSGSSSSSYDSGSSGGSFD